MKPISSLIGVLILSLTSGCASMHSSGRSEAKSPWPDFASAKAAFDSITPGQTSIAELRTLGFDPYANPNVRILNYLGKGLVGTFGYLTAGVLASLALPDRAWRGAQGLWWWVGLGGLATALAMTKAGLAVTVHERSEQLVREAGGTVIAEETGMTLEKATLADLGQAKRIEVGSIPRNLQCFKDSGEGSARAAEDGYKYATMLAARYWKAPWAIRRMKEFALNDPILGARAQTESSNSAGGALVPGPAVPGRF